MNKHNIVIGLLLIVIIILISLLWRNEAIAPTIESENATMETNTGSEATTTAEVADSNDTTEATPSATPINPAPAQTSPPTPSPAPSPAPPTFTIPNPENLGERIEVPASASVRYYDNRFWPERVYVLQGGTVRFINQSDDLLWVASNNHPTHNVYPIKAASDCAGSSFDQCTSVPAGVSWSFTFDAAGTWGYHNHEIARDTGTVVVVNPDDY